MEAACPDILAEGARRLGIAPERAAIERLCRYQAELAKWNRRINLVAAAPPHQWLETHFLDSLTLWPLIAQIQADCATEQQLSLLDIGSGAGFPGLVLKCWDPAALAVTLVEPRLKRVSFLRHLIRTLNLEGVRVLAQRLEPGQTLPETFTVITSRAFTALAPFLALCAPLSPPGGRVVCMKGPRAEDELARWRREQPHPPFRLEESRTFALPFSGAERNLLIFCKLN